MQTNPNSKTKGRISRVLLSKEQKKFLQQKWETDIIVSGRKLYNLRDRNLNIHHTNHRIYHLLCDPFTFNNAYSKISKNKGALTKGIDSNETTMLFYENEEAEKIAESFKKGTYKWSAVRRTLIPKPGKKKMLRSTIDIPSQRDCIVQEAIRGILESIFEPEFRNFEKNNNNICSNYGFRTGKSTWNAIEILKQKGQSTNYAIEGNISSAYNNVNHSILMRILKNRISDSKFLTVISDLLKAGIMENGYVVDNLKGTPQGGIVSPMLFNIYMFEFDKFVFNNIIAPIQTNNQEKKAKQNPEYSRLRHQCKKLSNKIHTYDYESKTEKNNDKCHLRKLHQDLFKVPYLLPETLTIKCVYARYADDWILFISSDVANCYKIKKILSTFLNNKLRLQLDSEKTLITKTTTGVNFLGYTYRMTQTKPKVRFVVSTIRGRKVRFKTRTTSRCTRIYPDQKKILQRLKEKRLCNNNHIPIGNALFAMLTPYEIVMKYNQMQTKLYNYYSEVDNFAAIYYAFYILQYSCARTIARRQKISLRQVFIKYGKQLTIPLFKGERKYTISLKKLPQLRETKKTKKQKQIDHSDPFHIQTNWPIGYF